MELERQVNNIWISVYDSISPFKVSENGSYRLNVIKEGCEDIQSNIIDVLCSINCPTTTLMEPIDSCLSFVVTLPQASTLDITYNWSYWEGEPTIYTETITYTGLQGLNNITYCGRPTDTLGYVSRVDAIIQCASCDTSCAPLTTFYQGGAARPSAVTDGKTEKNKAVFYPNPFSKGINLSLDASIAEAISIKAYNNVGLLIYEDILDVQQGNNVAYLEAFEKIPAGVYIIKLQSPTMEYVTRVIRIE